MWKLIRLYLLFDFLQILEGSQHKKNYIKVMKKYSVTHIEVILGLKKKFFALIHACTIYICLLAVVKL